MLLPSLLEEKISSFLQLLCIETLRYRFMAMERLGRDLQKVSEGNGGQMKRATVLQIGQRLVRGKVPVCYCPTLLFPLTRISNGEGKVDCLFFLFFFCFYVYASSLPSAVQLLTNGKMIVSKTMPHWFTSKADSLKGVVCSRTPMTTLGPQLFVCVPFSACVFPL